MQALVDSDICMGCGICEVIAPKVFRLDIEPYAIVLVEAIPVGEEEHVRTAMDQCPEQAINIKP